MCQPEYCNYYTQKVTQYPGLHTQTNMQVRLQVDEEMAREETLWLASLNRWGREKDGVEWTR